MPGKRMTKVATPLRPDRCGVDARVKEDDLAFGDETAVLACMVDQESNMQSSKEVMVPPDNRLEDL
jgi:hypothetical protein